MEGRSAILGVTVVLSAGLIGRDWHHFGKQWVLQALLLLLDLIDDRISTHSQRFDISRYLSPYLVFRAY